MAANEDNVFSKCPGYRKGVTFNIDDAMVCIHGKPCLPDPVNIA